MQPFPIFSQSNAVRIDAPLKLVIPFGPGSGTDVYARMVGQ
jgi:tripartite-type tricarboxylate transporter receptor subunit TctC